MRFDTTKLRALSAGGLLLCALACSEASSEPAAPGQAALVHLTDHLESADVTSAGPPPTAREERHWSLVESHADWHAVSSEQFDFLADVELEPLSDGVRLSMSQPGSFRTGGLKTELGELRFDDWDSVIVKARSSERFAGVTVSCNLEQAADLPGVEVFFASPDAAPPLFNDGSVQRYAIPLRAATGDDPPTTLRSIALMFAAPGPASVDILSVTLVPRGAGFLQDAGTRHVARGGTTRDSLFAHAPASIRFPVDVPTGGRLDFGLTVNQGETVTYRISSAHDETTDLLFEETVDDATTWHQRSVDLSGLAQEATHLVLEATSNSEGAVALWGAPILSGDHGDERPNVIFYVIDGGDADFMSLYGYGRPTTPFLEQLAQEGVLFTRAHSNSTWTQPSTVSFMTSLHHSVLGGLRRGMHSTSVPTAAVTMADHFRRAGYQTASFTANPNAGRIIGTEQGVDVMRDTETEHHSTSSLELQELLFDFRADYPGGPSWVHLQTTDVHEPNEPHEPFAGRFVTDEAREQLEKFEGEFWQAAGGDFGTTSVVGFYDLGLEKAGIDRQAYFGTRRDLYDETMLHQDHALEVLVDDLKARGEWENTLLVIGSDHGHPAGTFARFGRGLVEPQPEPWQGALFDAYATRVPLLFIWPAQIQGGRRVDEPVSMIDVLPTLLDLIGLPPPDVLQGQSLAPLLRGEDQELRPVILDEFRVDEASGEMIGNIEIIDGRWGASLQIGPVSEGADPSRGRHSVPAGGRWGAVHPYFPDVPRLLLYDLEQDPFTLRAVNEEHPDLVKRYTIVLLDQWKAHRLLSQRFGEARDITMTPEQLEQLRALGYIR